MKIIKRRKKIALFNSVVKIFGDNNDRMLSGIIPGSYIKSCIDPYPTNPDLVCVGVTAGARYYVPKIYRQVFSISDWGYWNYKITCPITGEEVVVSKFLGKSVEVRIFTEGNERGL